MKSEKAEARYASHAARTQTIIIQALRKHINIPRSSSSVSMRLNSYSATIHPRSHNMQMATTPAHVARAAQAQPRRAFALHQEQPVLSPRQLCPSALPSPLLPRSTATPQTHVEWGPQRPVVAEKQFGPLHRRVRRPLLLIRVAVDNRGGLVLGGGLELETVIVGVEHPLCRRVLARLFGAAHGDLGAERDEGTGEGGEGGRRGKGRKASRPGPDASFAKARLYQRKGRGTSARARGETLVGQLQRRQQPSDRCSQEGSGSRKN